MTNITLTEEAYAGGGSVRVGVCELTEWYEAAAEDNQGNQYRVVWKLKEDANPYDESDACDWESPWVILNEDGEDVSDEVELS
jgi:hypothetical protein